MSHPMINRWWVTTFCLLLSRQFHHNREWVTLHFSFASSLIMSLPKTNSMWVIFFFHLAVSSCHMPNSMWVTGAAFLLIHGCPCLIPWPTGGEWHILPCSIMSHPWSHYQQSVSDFFWQGSLIVSHPITNSMWVTVWHCIYFFRKSHLVSSDDQQGVSDTAFFAFIRQCHHCHVSSCLIYPITNRL